MRRLKEDILELRSQGKSYNDICQILNCSKGLVGYHCGEGQKAKTQLRRARGRKQLRQIISSRIERFSARHSSEWKYSSTTTFKKMMKARLEGFSKMSKMSKEYVKPEFSVEDLIKKIGDSPVCYISGKPIDLSDRRSWAIDHIVPRSRGGNNSIGNAGICDSTINMSKSNMLPEEFFEMCKMVLENNGYEVNKNAPTS